MRWGKWAGLRTCAGLSGQTWAWAPQLSDKVTRGVTPTSLGQNLHLALLHAKDQGQLYMFKTPNVCFPPT